MKYKVLKHPALKFFEEDYGINPKTVSFPHVAEHCYCNEGMEDIVEGIGQHIMDEGDPDEVEKYWNTNHFMTSCRNCNGTGYVDILDYSEYEDWTDEMKKISSHIIEWENDHAEHMKEVEAERRVGA